MVEETVPMFFFAVLAGILQTLSAPFVFELASLSVDEI